MTKHVVCNEHDIPPGTRHLVTIGTLVLGVYNIGGKFVAVRNVCPHRGAPLCLGELTGTTISSYPQERHWEHDGEILKCPWHGWEFKLPQGITVAEPHRRVQTYLVEVADGQVIVETGRKDRVSRKQGGPSED